MSEEFAGLAPVDSHGLGLGFILHLCSCWSVARSSRSLGTKSVFWEVAGDVESTMTSSTTTRSLGYAISRRLCSRRSVRCAISSADYSCVGSDVLAQHPPCPRQSAAHLRPLKARDSRMSFPGAVGQRLWQIRGFPYWARAPWENFHLVSGIWPPASATSSS